MERDPRTHQALQQRGCGRCHGGNMDRFTDKNTEAQRPLIGPQLSNEELRGTGGVLPDVSDAWAAVLATSCTLSLHTHEKMVRLYVMIHPQGRRLVSPLEMQTPPICHTHTQKAFPAQDEASCELRKLSFHDSVLGVMSNVELARRARN